MTHGDISITTKNMFGRRGEMVRGNPSTYKRRFPSVFYTKKELGNARIRGAKRGMKKVEQLMGRELRKSIKAPAKLLKTRVRANHTKARSRKSPSLFIGENTIKIEDTKWTNAGRGGGMGKFRARNPWTGKREWVPRAFESPKRKGIVLAREGGFAFPIERGVWRESVDGLWGSQTALRNTFLRVATDAVADMVFMAYHKELDKADRKGLRR